MHSQDIFQIVSGLANDATSAVKVVAFFLALVMFVYLVVQKRTLGAIFSAGFMALIFIWIVRNLGDPGLQQPIKDTILRKG